MELTTQDRAYERIIDGECHVMFVEIDSEFASVLLEQNSHNRNLKSAVRKKLLRQIEAGEWQVTNQGIGFDVDGVLLDGQHRLSAIADSDASVTCLVVSGLPRAGQSKLDVQSRRSMADRMKLGGRAEHKRVVQVATFIHTMRTPMKHPDDIHVREILDQYRDELRLFCEWGGLTEQYGVARISYLAPFIGLIARNRELAQVCMDKYITGSCWTYGDPMHVLRNHAKTKETFGGAAGRIAEARRAVTCMEKALKGQTIKKLHESPNLRNWC